MKSIWKRYKWPIIGVTAVVVAVGVFPTPEEEVVSVATVEATTTTVEPTTTIEETTTVAPTTTTPPTTTTVVETTTTPAPTTTELEVDFDSVMEDVFFITLDDYYAGREYPRAEALNFARSVCADLDSGMSMTEVMMSVVLVIDEDMVNDMGYILGVGVGAFCPEYTVDITAVSEAFG